MAIKSPANDNRHTTMDKHADWIDAFLCLAFSLASIGAELWIYWDLTLPFRSL